MSGCILPPSPSWYCSKISDNNEAGIFIYGARNSLHLLDTNVRPPRFVGDIQHAHGDRVTGLSLCKHAGLRHLCSSGGDDGKVKIWSLESKACLHDHRLHDKNKVTCVDWSVVKDDLVISGDDRGGLVCWNYTSGYHKRFTPEGSIIYCLTASPHDSRHVAAGYKSGLILLVDISQNGAILHRLRGHDDEVHCVVWCPTLGEEVGDNWRINETENGDTSDADPPTDQGCLLASGSRDRTIRLWSTTRGRQVSLLRLPSSHGQRRDKGEDWGRTRVWLTIYWPKCWPLQLVSSTQSGDLLHWTPFSSQKQKWQPLNHKEAGGHNRIVFNICCGGVDMDTLCTISMDRQIVVWSLRDLCSVQSIPTLGGFAYNIAASPVDPSRVAIGVGDQMIRVWNTGNPGNPYDYLLLWQGIRGKVTALSWHPDREGVLAYGTDDGRVGIYDVLSNRPPLVSNTYHKKTVYVVTWGPAVQQTDPIKVFHAVYSVGDGVILQHDPQKLDTPALQLNDEIARVNGDRKFPIRSEISWKSDFSVVAIGNDDGSVEVYQTSSMKLLCTVQVHRKLINCVRWHPQHVGTTSSPSPYRHWLACGSNESVIHVCDLGNILESTEDPPPAPVCITDSFCQLEDHSGRITGLSWSLHTDAMLVSASYDGTAKVWNVLKREPVACYTGHNGRLLTVLWSSVDCDVIFSGGDDFAAHQWKLSEWEGHEDKGGPQKRKKYKSKGRNHHSSQNHRAEFSDSPREPSSSNTQNELATQDTNVPKSQSVDISQVEELQKMLDEKRKLLEEQQQVEEGSNGQSGRMNVVEDKGQLLSAIFGSAAATAGEGTVVPPTHLINRTVIPSIDHKDRKKRKPKSLFPVSGAAENRSKGAAQEDCLHLAKQMWGKGPEDAKVDTNHLGLYLDRPQVYAMLRKEGDHHVSQGYIDGYLQLEIWKGNVSGALKYAAEHAVLSDWLMSIAPMASKRTYLELCEVYAQQLEKEGNYHKATSYYLACHKVYEAIDMLKRNRLFREAVALAKLRLSPSDPLLSSLQESWGRHLAKDGSYEQAAKCYLALKQPLEAAKLMARRADHSGLAAAAHVTISANEVEAGMVYAQRYVQECLAGCDWCSAVMFSKSAEQFTVLTLFVTMHEAVLRFLVNQKCLDRNYLKKSCPGGLFSSEALEHTELRKGDDGFPQWYTVLIEGETFMQYFTNLLKAKILPKSLEESGGWRDVYEQLMKWRAVKQGQLSTLQFLIHVALETTLGILALQWGDLEVASGHFLKVLSGAYELGHVDIMIELCRMLFPQGKLTVGGVRVTQPKSNTNTSLKEMVQSALDRGDIDITASRQAKNISPELFHTSRQECSTQDCLNAYIALSFLLDVWWKNAANCTARNLVSGHVENRELDTVYASSFPDNKNFSQNVEEEEPARSENGDILNQVSAIDETGLSVNYTEGDRESISSSLQCSAKAECNNSFSVQNSDHLAPLDGKVLQELCQALLWDVHAARNKYSYLLMEIEKTLAKNTYGKKDNQDMTTDLHKEGSELEGAESVECAENNRTMRTETCNVVTRSELEIIDDEGNMHPSGSDAETIINGTDEKDGPKCVRCDRIDCVGCDHDAAKATDNISSKAIEMCLPEPGIEEHLVKDDQIHGIDGSKANSANGGMVDTVQSEEKELKKMLERLPALPKNLTFPDPVESALIISYMLKHQYSSQPNERTAVIGWAKQYAVTTETVNLLDKLL
ncbi:gem-associated protein 5 [Lingula anatina]|uniref:Gem-associated protein 5 n=1 Tax=Lingula anatina TaxID=7574 RepID=A0A1S3K5E0_LINAN|nr:gem-associated protein 5 [Lingula anatina]|eukprot:XP_013417476.1 gem-associated protein 5 [Lingula anatina]